MKKNNILILFFVSILTTLLWRLFLPLNDEFLEISNIEINEIPLGFGEILVYFLIALLVSFSFIFPFLSNKNIQPKRPYWASIVTTILIVFSGLLILDNSIKGIYLVKYMGDDFPFIHRIINLYFLLPIAFFLITRGSIIHLKLRWLLPFFLINFLLLLTYLMESENTMILAIKNFRNAVSKGHFLFYGTFLLGLLSLILANRVENDALKS